MNHAQHEHRIRAEVEAAFRDFPAPWESDDVTVEEVALEGAYPDTELFIVFRSARRPGHRFRFDFAIWAGDLTDADASVVLANFGEDDRMSSPPRTAVTAAIDEALKLAFTSSPCRVQ